MDLQKLEAFVCVAKYKNFTKAAAELFITQPALSKKISDFEKEIGTTLLHRDNRMVELTAAGRLLYNEAHTLLKFSDDIESRVRAIGTDDDAKLTIGCTGIEYARLIDVVCEFRKIHPEIQISLHKHTAAEVKRLILSNMVDVGFQTRFEAESEENVDFIPFDQDKLYVVVGKNHDLANEKQISSKQLQEESYIAIQPTADHLPYARMINRLIEAGYTPKTILISTSVEEMVMEVSCNLAVGHLFGHTQRVYGNIMSYIEPSDFNMGLEVDIVWNISNQNPARQTLVDFVAEKNKELNLITDSQMYF